MTTVTLDTDTTVHTLYGRQMGGRKSYNPKNKVAAYEQTHCQFVIVARKTRRLVEQLQEPLPANNTFSGLRHVLQGVGGRAETFVVGLSATSQLDLGR